MQPIQSSQRLSPEARQALISALSEAGIKPEAIARFGELMQAVPSANVANQRNLNTTLQNLDKSLLVAVSKRLDLQQNTQLLLLRLPTTLPVINTNGQFLSFSELTPNKTIPPEVVLLVKLMPQRITQAIGKQLIQQIAEQLSAATLQPVQVKGTLSEVGLNTLKLVFPAVNTGAITLPKTLLDNVHDHFGKPEHLIGKTVVVDAKSVNGKWQIQLDFSPTLNRQETSKTANNSPMRVTSYPLPNTVTVPNDHPALKTLTQVQLHQHGMQIEHSRQLPATIFSQLPARIQQVIKTSSETMPVEILASGKQLTARSLQLQPLVLDTSPSSELLASLPNAPRQPLQTLPLSTVVLKNTPQVNLQVVTKTAPLDNVGSAMNESPENREPGPIKTKNDVINSHVGNSQPSNVQVATPTASLDKPLSSSIESLTPQIKKEVQQFIQTLLRFNAVNVEPKSVNIGAIIDSLQNVLRQTSKENAHTLSNIIQKLTPVGTSPDTQAIEPFGDRSKSETPLLKQTLPLLDTLISPQTLKQIFTSPAWMQSPPTLTASQPGQGLLGGLVQLLQIALLSKHIRNQDEVERLFHHQGKSPAGSAQSQPLLSVTPRMIREFNNADSQHHILKQLKSLLASHQQSKLSSAEQTLQGQDTFYYLLPAFQQHQKQAEILIKRDPEHSAKNRHGKQQHRWQLTMKLSIGEHGDLLTKVNILDTQIDLDIYTSNQLLQEKVANALPFLLKRFAQLGMSIERHKVQLGKIPDTLATKPYQILETMA